MKKISYWILAVLASVSCNFLEPLPDGTYDENNYDEYPVVVKGLVYKLYLLQPTGYEADEFIGTDAASDNCVFRDKTHGLDLVATGSADMQNYPMAALWDRDYEAIYYANMFLKDNMGLNTRIYIGWDTDLTLRRSFQGDAYGMRAWYLADLLKVFGGRGVNGKMLGVPFFQKPVTADELDRLEVKRLSYDETVEQILRDCDSALVYLPLANRDFIRETEIVPVTGSFRYGMMDQISVKCLKALTCLTWASPAFNPDNDMARWVMAAQCAKEVIDYKLDVEGKVANGFVPKDRFSWCVPNATEAIMVSRIMQDQILERKLYPQGFGGTGDIGVTQELVDAFPMANGYPIDSPLSGYDPQNPYAGRDPRLYSTVFFNGSSAVRATNNQTMYTFDTTVGGRDAVGGINVSPTGYYVKKFLYAGWNPNDTDIQTSQRTLFFYRWAQMCLAFAEAANHVVGPTDSATFGLSAKDALAYLRNRTTEDGVTGLGTEGDPYLDECSRDAAAFDRLVRNEWRIETCFEGRRFYDIRRWASSVDEINKPVHGVKITTDKDGNKSYESFVAEQRSFPSLWLPLPYDEVLKTHGTLIQNEGWSSWK